VFNENAKEKFRFKPSIRVWKADISGCHTTATQKLFLARSSSTSSYLNSLVDRYLPSRTLRSQDTNLLAVLRTKTVFGSRAFRVTAPTVLNSLPQDIRSTDSICKFCRLLKTFYFRNAFNQHQRHHPCIRFNIFCWHCGRKENNTYLLTDWLTYNSQSDYGMLWFV